MRTRRHQALASALVLTALAAVPATAGAARYARGHVIVAYRAHGAHAARHGAAPSQVVRLRGESVRHALTRLRARSDVAYAVPDYIAHATAFIPNDPGRGTAAGWQDVQWNFGGPPGWGVDAPDAWANAIAAGAPGGVGVKIAVLDTGVAYANRGRYHRSPDLVAGHFMRGYDFVDHDPYPNDTNGHGTHVTSTIAEATNNHLGLTGLAYDATIIPVRVLDSQGEGESSDIAKGVRFAVSRGAKIINLSLEFSSDVTAHQIPELISALTYAHRKGVLLVGASGNEAHSSIAYPARAQYVMSVGSTTQHGCLSDFSNDGRGLDIVAPGGGSDANIPGDPNCRPLDPPGEDVYQITFEGQDVRRFGLPGGYEGTSMAAPHVTATAALIISSKVIGAKPTPGQLEARLKATARDLGPQGYDTRYGAGLLNAAAATAPPAPPPPPAEPPPSGTTGPTGAK